MFRPETSPAPDLKEGLQFEDACVVDEVVDGQRGPDCVAGRGPVAQIHTHGRDRRVLLAQGTQVRLRLVQRKHLQTGDILLGLLHNLSCHIGR